MWNMPCFAAKCEIEEKKNRCENNNPVCNITSAVDMFYYEYLGCTVRSQTKEFNTFACNLAEMWFVSHLFCINNEPLFPWPHLPPVGSGYVHIVYFQKREATELQKYDEWFSSPYSEFTKNHIVFVL